MRPACQIIALLVCPFILMGQTVFAEIPDFPPAEDLSLAVPEVAPVMDQVPLTPGVIYSAMGQSCETTLAVAPGGDAGTMRLDLQSPCRRGQRVDLTWSGLTASFLTSVTGALQVDLPVLEPENTLQAAFPDGTFHQVQLTEDAPIAFTGVGLTWRGSVATFLHVLENGADFGGVGHRHAARPVGAAGGQIFTLGDPRIPDGWFSQVYLVAKAQGPLVSRTFTEIPVTANNCGGTQDVTLHQFSVTGSWMSLPFEFSVPPCDKTGQSVMLGSPLRDLVLAEE